MTQKYVDGTSESWPLYLFKVIYFRFANFIKAIRINYQGPHFRGNVLTISSSKLAIINLATTRPE